MIRVRVKNDVCPQCAGGFALPGGIVVPAKPNHDACMGDVRDPEAPGGGWVCRCSCRALTPADGRKKLWVPGWAKEAASR